MKKKEKTFTFTKSVRVWLAVISIVNVGDSLQFFVNYSLLSTQIYTLSPQYANPAFGRIYGILIFILAVLRLSCAIDIHNKSNYNLTLVSFVLLFGNTLLELLVYRTVQVNFSILLNLFLSGVSIILMLLGYSFVREDPSIDLEADKFERRKKS